MHDELNQLLPFFNINRFSWHSTQSCCYTWIPHVHRRLIPSLYVRPENFKTVSYVFRDTRCYFGVSFFSFLSQWCASSVFYAVLETAFSCDFAFFFASLFSPGLRSRVPSDKSNRVCVPVCAWLLVPIYVHRFWFMSHTSLSIYAPKIKFSFVFSHFAIAWTMPRQCWAAESDNWRKSRTNPLPKSTPITAKIDQFSSEFRRVSANFLTILSRWKNNNKRKKTNHNAWRRWFDFWFADFGRSVALEC